MLNKSKSIRFILTQRCNYNCVFCHKEGLIEEYEEKMDVKDYAFLFHVVKKYFNINEVNLTGGEPLLRSDITDIIYFLKLLGGKIVITTNGYFLHKIRDVRQFIDRINISIHSLNLKKYELIVSKSNTFTQVMNNLMEYKNIYPHLEIRLNTTLIKGHNSSKEDILKYIKFAKKVNASIKYVELFAKKNEGFVSNDEVEKILKELNFKKINEKDRKKDFTDGETLIRLSKIFCSFVKEKNSDYMYCKMFNELFITPSGEIKMCRLSRRKINILDEVKLRQTEKLIHKLSIAFDMLGEDCVYMRDKK